MNRRHTFFVVSIVILTWLAPRAYSADLKYKIVSSEVLVGRLKDAPKKNTDRAAALSGMFKQAGCEPTDEAVKGVREPNVLCVLRGSSDSTIVVGAHIDHVEEGDGIVDDWSGASMLPALYESLAGEPRTHTFLFIGFAGEERGAVGSEFYVKHLTPQQRVQVAGMVNLECLGMTSTKVWAHYSDPIFVRMLFAISESLKLPLSAVNVEDVASDDAQSFTRYKIPHITIHSVTPATFPYLHSKNDTLQAINTDLYYDSYRIIVPFLVSLDQQVPTDGSPIGKPK
jgi:hypothetical protein